MFGLQSNNTCDLLINQVYHARIKSLDNGRGFHEVSTRSIEHKQNLAKHALFNEALLGGLNVPHLSFQPFMSHFRNFVQYRKMFAVKVKKNL